MRFRECALGDDGTREIARAVARLPNVLVVDLARNAFGDDGAAAVAELVRASRTLVWVDVARNRVPSRTASSGLARAVRESRSVRMVRVVDEDEGEDGGADDVGRLDLALRAAMREAIGTRETLALLAAVGPRRPTRGTGVEGVGTVRTGRDASCAARRLLTACGDGAVVVRVWRMLVGEG